MSSYFIIQLIWLSEDNNLGDEGTIHLGKLLPNNNSIRKLLLGMNRTEGCTTDAMDWAAQKHLEVVKWLHMNRTEGFLKEQLILLH